MKYNQDIFIPASFEHAKDIVLTPTDPNRFENETNQFMEIISNENIISSQKIVLDFGCGMGRISKQLVNRFDCEVIGLDTSIDMLKLATMYVANHNRFVTCSSFIRENVIDVCIAAYVLQHVEYPVKEIETIANAVRKDGYLVLLNESNNRLIPGNLREDNSVIWYNDYFDVFAEVEKYFTLLKSIPIDNVNSVKIYKK